ncbi:hypothetical protein N7462_005938 [Penicillium macrosclerotiorum]|uniref:uncharacterized protein n=1 Tax=Penicillium macrosclerotiorum TaxID=303699 RepID=UPI002547A8C0|nr:uncharacterized protein N7462_005938 [Penicillium macrosclerotiorum]KAJ5682773.1 hypothetical protein N7462_005938 [Penicillium macrosclerotiorum]
MSRLCGFVVESNRVRRLDRDELDQLDLDTEAAPFIDRDSGTHAQHGVLLGAKYPLQDWAEVPENQYHSPLTIADAANPLFADFQHHCMNVFAIHDDLSYFDEARNAWRTLDDATVSYLVVGFHAESQYDPLAASKAASNRALLDSHRMTLSQLAVVDASNIPENPWLDEAPAKKHRVRSLCHGIVAPLRWSKSEPPGRVPADEAAQHFTRQQPIAIGTDLIDALTASVTAPADASTADPAQAEAFKHLETLATDPGDDGQETSAAAQTRSNQFKPAPGGHIWTWKKPADEVKDEAPEAETPATPDESMGVQTPGSEGVMSRVASGAAAPEEQPLATTPTTASTAPAGSPASSAKTAKAPTSPDTNTKLKLRQLNAIQALYDSALRHSALLQHQLFCEWWKARAAGYGDPGEDDPDSAPDDGFDSMQRWYAANLSATRSRVRDILTKIFILRHRGDPADADHDGLVHGLAYQLAEPNLATAHKMPCGRFFSARDPTVLLRGLESSWPEDFTKDTMEVQLNTQLIQSMAKTAATTKEDDDDDDDWPAFRSQLTSLPQWVYACVEDLQRGNWQRRQLQWQPATSEQAWFPLFIEWEADYFHIPYHHWALKETANGTVRYAIRGDVDLTDAASGVAIRSTRRGLSGRSNILPEGPRALTTLVNQVFQRAHPDTLALEEEGRNAVRTAVAAMTDLLSSELEGITDHLLTLVRGTHSTPAAIDSTAVSRWLGLLFPQLAPEDHAVVLGFLATGTGADVTPYTALLPVQGVGMAQGHAASGLFRPVTHGQVRFTKFNIVDKFGQVVCAFDPRPGQPLRPLYPSVSEDLACQRNAMLPGRFFANAAEAEPEGRCQFFQLGPRINQDARFNAAFVVREETSTVRAWRPLTAWENPIWGWLVCNFQDDSLQVFEGDGTLAGEILVGASPKGRWLHPQLGGASHITPTVRNQDLAALMERLAGSSAFLHQVWDMVVEANESIHHAPDTLADFLPALVGRPLALVSMGWSLELATAPMRDQTDTGGPTDDLLGYAFELKLGDRRSMHDGLVAYIPEDVNLTTEGSNFAFDRVYTRYGLDIEPRQGRRAREDGGEPGSMPPGSQVVPAKMLSFQPYWIDPTDYRMDQADQFMAAHNRKLQVFAALIDPSQSVHGFSGILPTTTLTVPPAALQDALKQIGTFLRVGPLLIPGELPVTPAAAVDSTVTPSAAVLPLDAPAEGSWTWMQPLKSENSGSRQFSLTPASKLFAVPDGPQTVVEGYLKLDTVNSPDQ